MDDEADEVSEVDEAEVLSRAGVTGAPFALVVPLATSAAASAVAADTIDACRRRRRRLVSTHFERQSITDHVPRASLT